MTENYQFIFSATLFQPNIFRLTLFGAFFDACFAQNKFLTELNSPISGVHSSSATLFQYPNFSQSHSYSKPKLSHGCNLQWWKPFVDIFFHVWEIWKQTLGNIKKTALILSSESVNKLIRGVVAAVRVTKNHFKSTSIVFLLYLQQFVSTPLSLLCVCKVSTELRIHDVTIFRTAIIFVLIFLQLLIFRMRWKSPNLFVLECSFHWWEPFYSI